MNLIGVRPFCQMTGWTEEYIMKKMHRGAWVINQEYRKAPDGTILIDMEGYNAWVLKGYQPPEERTVELDIVPFPPTNRAEIYDKPRRERLGRIYFIQGVESKAIKIGFSTNPSERVASIQTAMPEDLVLLGVIEGTIAREGELHRQFKHLHRRGEWFSPGPDLLAFMHGGATP